MKNPYSLGLRRLALGVAATGLLQASASAQFDATISDVEVTQAMQNGGNLPLCAGRATFVRVSVDLFSPPVTPLPLDGLMRVYDNGVEVPESPIFSINGPNPMQASSNTSVLDGTLNFYYVPPLSDNVVIEVEINPAGPNFVAETNTANNKFSTPVLNFQERAVPEYAYSRIDYRPSGGGFNPPPENLIEPGVGDNFIQGIYASSDIHYHRTDQEYKLWTNSLAGSGTGLLNSLLSNWNSMSPKPDFLYGWVPGGLPYNGVAFLNSPVAMGNTQAFKNQRTYAHEVGHNVGRQHVSNNINRIGIDVEHHLALPASNNLPQIKSNTKFDIMVAGLNTVQAWVRPNMYQYVFNHNKYNPGPVQSYEPSIFMAGVWNTQTGAVDLTHVFAPPQGKPSQAASAEETAFVVNTYRGDDLVYRLPIAKGTPEDSCADGTKMREVGIQAIVPQSAGYFDRVEISPVAGVAAQSVTLRRSPNAPFVQFANVGDDGDVSAGVIEVSWSGIDLDGDEISYYLSYSRDGYRFSPLADAYKGTSFTVDMRGLPAVIDGVSYFQLLASDGLNTTVVNSSTVTGGNTLFPGGGNPPWVYIVTPDAGNIYQRGTTVFLHSSGWDLEDNAITGSQIQWTSDVDGAIGSGRMTSTASLSVGVHMITVTATDSDAMTATDTHLVEITDRQLPTVAPTGPVVYCTPGTSASGCNASISATGTPSATASSGFTLDTTGVEGSKDGLYFFGSNGRQANPWGSGTSFQCVVPPVIRAGLLSGVGTTGQCDGSFSQDLNALWCPTCPNPAKNPGAGALVQAQTWHRDPLNTSNQTTSLSDAIEFTVQP